MAPTFKISFPLPRRPSASPSTATPGSQYSNQSHRDDSPITHPGTKAERTLGTSEPDLPERKKKLSRKERKQLGKSPSFMSVTLSDIDSQDASALDAFPFPGMLTPNELQQSSTQYPGRKASSPLLGEFFNYGSTKENNRGVRASPQARGIGSAPASPSHYDANKMPLPISQQTSASSARDMALRKGFPPISNPSEFRKIDGIEDAESITLHVRRVSGDSKLSTASKLSGNSIRRINSVPRRRPSVNDPPTLYPEANRTFHPVSPPPALINSTLPKMLPPNNQPTRPKWWQRKISSPRISPSIPSDEKHDTDAFEANFSSVKVNVKRPKTGVTGDRNWFDDLEDDDQTIEELQPPETLRFHRSEKPEPSLNIDEVISRSAPPSQITSRKSSFSNKSQRTIPSDRKLSFRLDPPSEPARIPSSLSPTTSQRIKLRSQSHSPHSSSSKKAIHQGIDLQIDSFLELSSSSEDEGGGGGVSQELHPQAIHKVSANNEGRSNHEEILGANFQDPKPAKPRSSINRTPSRPLSKRSTSSEYVPPVPRIPDKPRLTQRNSSMRWREIMEEKAASTESTIDSGASSLNENVYARKTNSARNRKKQSTRGSKLMKVTSEEEKLLEAMREKRASIRHDDFEKGFKTAMQLQDIVTRPKTAGADGRTSLSSTVYGSRSSISPPPPLEHGIRRHLAGSRLSASVDDLLLEDAYPFPEVPRRETRDEASPWEWDPPGIKSPMGIVPASKTSPSLSFGPSEILPSTPTSHNSPITPASGHVPLGYGRSSTLSPSRGSVVMKKMGHDRKRTDSSSVLMLDGVEQQAQQLDEESWAMNRW